MNFSSLQTTYSIVQPLRYFFRHYSPEGFRWDQDVRVSQIEIGSINDLNKEKMGQLPRILVDRGPYTVSKNWISEDMATAKSYPETGGLRDQTNHMFVEGQARVSIKSREEGVCELLTDMVATFLGWSSHEIAKCYGYKTFGRPMSVSPCVLQGEETEIFVTQIIIPYSAEQLWRIRDDAVKIKGIDFKLY